MGGGDVEGLIEDAHELRYHEGLISLLTIKRILASMGLNTTDRIYTLSVLSMRFQEASILPCDLPFESVLS